MVGVRSERPAPSSASTCSGAEKSEHRPRVGSRKHAGEGPFRAFLGYGPGSHRAYFRWGRDRATADTQKLRLEIPVGASRNGKAIPLRAVEMGGLTW